MTITLKPKCPAPTLEAVQETKAFSSTCGEKERREGDTVYDLKCQQKSLCLH